MLLASGGMVTISQQTLPTEPPFCYFSSYWQWKYPQSKVGFVTTRVWVCYASRCGILIDNRLVSVCEIGSWKTSNFTTAQHVLKPKILVVNMFWMENGLTTNKPWINFVLPMFSLLFYWHWLTHCVQWLAQRGSSLSSSLETTWLV